MRVLVVGAGAREHALAWKLARSPRVGVVTVTPGNPGMRDVARVLPGGAEPEALLAAARQARADLVVIGPEAPLVAGAADLLGRAGVPVFGPGAAGARLEGSKRFAKEFMVRHAIPTARFAAFSDEGAALDYLRAAEAPVVVKDSGLAAGKGVTLPENPAEAEEAVRRVFRAGRPGAAPEVVIEERLTGPELSLLLLTDGSAHLPLPLARDYKHALDGDLGPMTGGMGAVAPPPPLPDGLRERLDAEVVRPTLAGLARDGIPFRGVLYVGLMLTPDGPRVLEYNTRFGDPETQVLLPLLDSDLVELLELTVAGRLREARPRWSRGAAAGVVMAAPGYPGEPQRGIPLTLPAPEEGTLVFQAGTAERDGRLVTSGGRVLTVVGTGPDLPAAVAAAYRGVERIGFPGAHYRRDIGTTPGGTRSARNMRPRPAGD